MSYTGYGQDSSLGDISRNLMGPLGVLSKMFMKISFGFGVFLVLLAWIRYLRHRRNPLQTPMSDVWFVFLLGLALIALPFISQFAKGQQLLQAFS